MSDTKRFGAVLKDGSISIYPKVRKADIMNDDATETVGVPDLASINTFTGTYNVFNNKVYFGAINNNNYIVTESGNFKIYKNNSVAFNLNSESIDLYKPLKIISSNSNYNNNLEFWNFGSLTNLLYSIDGISNIIFGFYPSGDTLSYRSLIPVSSNGLNLGSEDSTWQNLYLKETKKIITEVETEYQNHTGIVFETASTVSYYDKIIIGVHMEENQAQTIHTDDEVVVVGEKDGVQERMYGLNSESFIPYNTADLGSIEHTWNNTYIGVNGKIYFNYDTAGLYGIISQQTNGLKIGTNVKIDMLKFVGYGMTCGVDFRPETTNTYSIGDSTHYWKSVYADSYEASAGLFTFNGGIKPKTSGNRDLGNSTYKWKDLYLSGNVVLPGKTAITFTNVDSNITSISGYYQRCGNVVNVYIKFLCTVSQIAASTEFATASNIPTPIDTTPFIFMKDNSDKIGCHLLTTNVLKSLNTISVSATQYYRLSVSYICED